MPGPLIFADEFDAPDFWEQTHAPSGLWRDNYGYGGLADYKFNDELQIYAGPYFEGHAGDFDDGNHVYAGGTLSLIAKKTTDPEVLAWNQGGYSSGMITTRGAPGWFTADGKATSQFSFQYGYVEARIDPSDEPGAWNALWMLPAAGDRNGWAYAEIDIMESVGRENGLVFQAVHGAANNGSYASVNVLGNGFHTFGFQWTPTHLTWFIDGVQTKQIATPSDMHQPMVLIANLAVGGSWAGTPDFGADGEAAMVIDYIRVYGLDGSTPPPPQDEEEPPPPPQEEPEEPAEPPPPVTATSLRIVDVAPVLEGDSGSRYMVFDVRRDGDASGPTTAEYAITGVDAADVASPLSGKLWFGGGETVKQVWVEVRGDTLPEADETVTITLSNVAGADLADGVGQGVVLNDDEAAPPPPDPEPEPEPDPEPEPEAPEGRTIEGGRRNDRLEGTEGDDTLIGRGGRDTLEGGEGDDLLFGGPGDDRFVFAEGFGHDVIAGFSTGRADKLLFDEGLGEFGTEATDFGLMLTFETGDSLLLLGVGRRFGADDWAVV